MRKSISGFTIVELLIVIVVLAIIAAIAMVSYSGMQQRARMGVARADVRNLGQAMELFRVEHGTYPRIFTPSLTPQTELEQILRRAGVYEATRADRELWEDEGIYPAKRFVFCVPEGDVSRYAIVVDHPLLTDNIANDIGKTTVYVDNTGRVSELVVEDLGEHSVQATLCRIATGTAVAWQDDRWSHWSNAVPLGWAE